MGVSFYLDYFSLCTDHIVLLPLITYIGWITTHTPHKLPKSFFYIRELPHKLHWSFLCALLGYGSITLSY